MTLLSDRPLPVAEVDKSLATADDDASDVTPNDSRNFKGKNKPVAEKVIKFRFLPQNRSDDPIHPRLVHIQWLREVQEAVGKDIDIYDNKGRKVPKVDPLRWTNESHEKVFDTHTQLKSLGHRTPRNSTGREQTSFIVHRIQTSWNLSEIKSLPSVYKLLRDHGVYLTEHRWRETIWNTTQLGFIVGLDPQFYDPEQAVELLTQELKKQLGSKTKIPHFRMAYCTPSSPTKQNRTVRTKAYAIETEKTTSMEMLKLLKSAFKETGKFIPFQMRSKYPDAFANAIQAQTQTLSTNHTIVLNNIGTDAILYLSNWIEDIEGVEDIVPYRTVEYDGKFRILVNKKDFHRIRNFLIENLPQWLENHVAPDAQPRHGRFPGDPEVAPLSSDGYSSGEDSYMATSVNTMMSYDETQFPTAKSESTSPLQQERTARRNRGTTVEESHLPSNATWAERRANQNPQPSPPINVNLQADIEAEQYSAFNTHQLRADLERSNAEVDSLKQELRQLQTERRQYQEDLDTQVQQKVDSAIQAHLEKVSQPPPVSTNQFEMLMAFQAKQFQDFSLQILQMLNSSGRNDTIAEHTTVTTGKRGSVETHGDTSSITDSCNDPSSEDRKRADLKPTPQKQLFPDSSYQSPDTGQSPRYQTPSSEWSQSDEIMLEDTTTDVNMSIAVSEGAHANTVQPEEWQERVEGSHPKSKPGQKFPWEDPFATPKCEDV